MKKLLCLFFLLQCGTFVFAGEDSVYVQIVNDTIQVWNVGAVENCCISVVTTTNISHDSIIVLEHDTATAYCYCICTFDFSVSLTGLQPGTYHVLVFRQYTLSTPESLYYIGGTSFIYGGGISNEVTSIAYQSGCYNPPVGAGEETNRMPAKPALSQNYPNPFNPTTIIKYDLPQEAYVTLKVYNLLSQEVMSIIDETQTAGFKSIQCDLTNYPSGVYVYRLTANAEGNSFTSVNKMVVVK